MYLWPDADGKTSFHNVPVVDAESGSDSDVESKPMSRGPPSSVSHSSPKKLIKKLSLPPDFDDREEMLEEIARSHTTRDCNLSCLRLKKIPNGIPMDVLTRISLSENELVTLPEALFSGKHGQALVQFDVNSNRLTSVPAGLFQLPKLEVLMLNHNNIDQLPLPTTPKDASRFLPSLREFGCEFNNLRRFPMELLELCPHITEVLLGQNEHMLDNRISYNRLRACSIGKRYAADSSLEPVLIKMDNRPRLMQQMSAEEWEKNLPWLKVELHKIYPDKVLDFLFLGSVRTAQTVTVYHDLDIQYVLTAGRDLEVQLEPGMKHLVLNVDDLPEQDITLMFEKAFAFIDAARADKKGVLIHCFAGLSRSVTIATAYVMKNEHMTRDAALALVRKARPAAQPNEGFMKCLLRYEEYLKGIGS